MTEDSRRPGPSERPHEEPSDVDWPTWLRSRLEQGPQFEEASPTSAIADELKSLSQTVAAVQPGTDPEVLAEVRALKERVEALRTGPDPEVLATLEALRESVSTRPEGLEAIVTRLDGLKEVLAAQPAGTMVMAEVQALREAVDRLPTGRDPAEAREYQAISEAVALLPAALQTEIAGPLRSLSELIETWPTGPHPAIVSRLEALSKSVSARPDGMEPVVARLNELTKLIAEHPPASSVLAELGTLKEAVSRLPTGRDPAEVQELRAVKDAVASIPDALETEVVSRLHSLTEIVGALPSAPQLVARLDDLDATVAAIPTAPDANIIAGLYALKAAVNSFVEVLADLPAMVRRVLNARSDELDEMVERILKESTVDGDAQERIEASLTALGRGVSENLHRLSKQTDRLAERQAETEKRGNVMGEALERLADVVQSGSSSGGGTLHLEETQVQAIAAAVVTMMDRGYEQAGSARPLRTRSLKASEPSGRPASPPPTRRRVGSGGVERSNARADPPE